MSVTSILNIAKNALFAQQTALQVASNNIANVNTKGYARQEAVLTEGDAVTTGLGFFLGSGVSVPTVMSHYDSYLESSIARENNLLEEQKTYEQYFGRIEIILDENNTNLTNSLVQFFNSWQELSTDPLNTTSRINVAAEGANLSNGIRSIFGELKDIQTQTNDNIELEVSDINDMLHSIALLNGQIYGLGTSGGENDTLINQRTQLVNQLSGKIDIQSFQDKEGGLTILTSGGKVLVDRETVLDLRAEIGSTNGFYRITWDGDDVTDSIRAGTLKGLVDLRDNQIAGFLDTIDDLAQSLMTEVNNVHRSGYDANGGTGTDFFKNVTQDYAATFDISEEIKADPASIAGTSSATNPSNNDIALAIADLGSASITIEGRNTTYVDYGASIASRIGTLSQNAKDLSDYHQTLMTTIQKQRDSASGVSIDEEMSNLIKFQYAYQAAARLMNTADALMNTLLEIGR